VTQLQGTTEATPSALVGSPTIATCPGSAKANECVTWSFTPATIEQGWYQVHVLATAADGQKLACDGKVHVRAVVLPT
jgi:hypothetical protein